MLRSRVATKFVIYLNFQALKLKLSLFSASIKLKYFSLFFQHQRMLMTDVTTSLLNINSNANDRSAFSLVYSTSIVMLMTEVLFFKVLNINSNANDRSACSTSIVMLLFGFSSFGTIIFSTPFSVLL